MTCIAGLVAEGKVWMGADSAGASGYDLKVRADKKLVVIGQFLMGFTTSFRMAQVLSHGFTPPQRHPDRDVMAFMVCEFIDSVRNALKAAGYARKDSEVESGGDFLVGYEGRLFHICSDYQVAESADAFNAVGCGAAYAQGSLFSTPDLPPHARIAMALRAAEAMSAGVRGPFVSLSI